MGAVRGGAGKDRASEEARQQTEYLISHSLPGTETRGAPRGGRREGEQWV